MATQTEKTRRSHIFAALLLALPLAACDSGSDDGNELTGEDSFTPDGTGGTDGTTGEDPGNDGTSDVGSSFIRLLHLSPDAPAVDVYAGDARVVEAISFVAGTDYLEVPAGTYDFHITPAGDDVRVLSLADQKLQAGGYYTALAYGELQQIQGAALADDRGEELAAGNIRVRPIHAADGVGIVDIWNLPKSGERALLYGGVNFGDSGDYIDLPSDSYTLGFDTDGDTLPEAIFEVPQLPAGTIANVFAVLNDGKLELVAQLQESSVVPLAAGSSRVRVLHLSPDAPPVDVFVNAGDDPAVSGLTFGDGTDYVDLPSAAYDFAVSPSGLKSGESVLDIEGLILRPDSSYTAVAFGPGSGIQALALEDDFAALPENTVRLRAIHAAVGVGEVDIWNVTAGADPAPLYENVGFGAAGGYLDLPVGSYTVGFDVDKDGTPDLTFDIPELPAGTVANVFAVNNDGVYLLAQLNDGKTVRIDANQ